jgi:hypothetical protein
LLENRRGKFVLSKIYAKRIIALRASCFPDDFFTLLVPTTIVPAQPKSPLVRLLNWTPGELVDMTTTRTEGMRQSDRVSFRMPLEASWMDNSGIVRRLLAQSLLVSRNGGVLCMQEKFFPGQEISLKRTLEGDGVRTVRARIVAEIDREPEGFLYAVHILESRADFWGIEFPSLHKDEDALARLLMECSFCQRREVVYLNELELKSFESRRCVARICKFCDAPSIWIEAQSELASTDSPASRTLDVDRFAVTSADDRVLPRRNRNRVKARVLACIRRRGFQEEVAVCEDLSKGGIAFRSRNEYPEGTRVEVAVPFTPGAGAIFVPIRIVFSQRIPAAGLFRHGAAYLKPPE